jgi:hypothetical protein
MMQPRIASITFATKIAHCSRPIPLNPRHTHPSIEVTEGTVYELFTVKMGKKRVLCGYGIDIDAVAGWLGSYGGEDSTSDISRGMYSDF